MECRQTFEKISGILLQFFKRKHVHSCLDYFLNTLWFLLVYIILYEIISSNFEDPFFINPYSLLGFLCRWLYHLHIRTNLPLVPVLSFNFSVSVFCLVKIPATVLNSPSNFTAGTLALSHEVWCLLWYQDSFCQANTIPFIVRVFVVTCWTY